MEKIKIEVDREDVKNMLKGMKPATRRKCIELEGIGFMKFTGNQHNEEWSWDFEKLKKEAPTAQRLYEFYTHMKNFNNKIKR